MIKENDKTSVGSSCRVVCDEREIGNLPIMPKHKRTPTYCLSDAVDSCFSHYYDSLKGMSPAPNLYHLVLEEFERPLLERTLKFVKGNQLRAAEILGLNRNTLRKKIKQLDIDVAQFAQRD